MKNKHLLLSFICSLSVATLLTSSILFCPGSLSAQKRAPAPTQKEKEPYRIGVTNSITGYAAALGTSSRNGITMAIDEINKRGGVEGHKLEAVSYDNKSDDSTALLTTRKLIEKDKVDALIVSAYSGAGFACLDTSERSKIPMFSIAGSTKLWRPTRAYSFCVVPGADLLEKARARWIKSKGYTKVAQLSSAGPYAEECSEFFKQEAKNFGLTIVANEEHKANDTDMSVQLSKIAAAKPDVIVIATYPHPGAIIAKNAKLLGINIPLLGCYAMTSEAWINIAKDAAEGWNGAVVSHELGEQTPPWKSTYPIVKAYAESYHKRFGESTTSTCGNAYDSVYMIAAGLKEMGEEGDLAKRREKLAHAIENLQNFFALNGPYYMSPSNHNGTGEWAISIVKIVNGKMVIQN